MQSETNSDIQPQHECQILHVISLALLIIAFWTIGCNKGTPSIIDPAEIKLVKQGILPENKSLTIGEAIDGYRYAKKVVWTIETSFIDERKKFVRARVFLDLEKIQDLNLRWKDNFADIIVSPIFVINKDGSFDYSPSFWGVITKDGKVKYDPNERINKYEFIKMFYNNLVPDIFSNKSSREYDYFIKNMVDADEYIAKQKEKRGIK